METLKQDDVDAKEEGDDEAVEILRDTLKKSRENAARWWRKRWDKGTTQSS